ncbi:MAG: hypothetical protein RIT35_312 [Pseudomonadota bacterium]|jgi:transcriptional regulator of arginine metabolism
MKQSVDQVIFSIIENQTITEQSELLRLLHEAGFELRQSGLSRRLQKLAISKWHGVYVVAKPSRLGNASILHIDRAPPNMIIIHTTPGSAPAIAFKLDQYIAFKSNKQNKVNGILATIAGDDTVLVVIDIKLSLEIILQQIGELL